MLARQLQRGDTLIEVLFALAVFSMVAVGALGIMSTGSAMAERSLETSIVTQTLNDQASTLRFMHDSYVASYVPGETFNPNATNKDAAWQWQAMVNYIQKVPITSVKPMSSATSCVAAPPSGSFIVNPQAGTFVQHAAFTQPATYAKVTGSSSQGVWIEAIQSVKSANQYQQNIGYIDFHIMACWAAPNSQVPMTLSTIVRLYEPR